MRNRAVLVAMAVFIAIATALALYESKPVVEERSGVWIVQCDGWSYSFDAVWRTEHLVRTDAGSAVDDRLAVAPDVADRLRQVLLAHLGVESVEAIPASHAEEVEALRALGYL